MRRTASPLALAAPLGTLAGVDHRVKGHVEALWLGGRSRGCSFGRFGIHIAALFLPLSDVSSTTRCLKHSIQNRAVSLHCACRPSEKGAEMR